MVISLFKLMLIYLSRYALVGKNCLVMEEEESLAHNDHGETNIGRFRDIPRVILSCIWTYLNVVEHITFRRCSQYLCYESLTRSDIGPLTARFVLDDKISISIFARMAQLRPYGITYAIDRNGVNPNFAIIWSTISTLRELHGVFHQYRDGAIGIPSSILLTQTQLTSLHTATIEPVMNRLTKLLELRLHHLQADDEHFYLPSSLTSLSISSPVSISSWSNTFIPSLPHLSSLCITLSDSKANRQWLILNGWSSLRNLQVDNEHLDGDVFGQLLHPGTIHPSSLQCILPMSPVMK
jgi:hypothetical protein